MVGTEGAARTAGYERIVVPLDGSQLAEDAIAHAEFSRGQRVRHCTWCGSSTRRR